MPTKLDVDGSLFVASEEFDRDGFAGPVLRDDLPQPLRRRDVHAVRLDDQVTSELVALAGEDDLI